jgi:hypothetical protein
VAKEDPGRRARWDESLIGQMGWRRHTTAALTVGLPRTEGVTVADSRRLIRHSMAVQRVGLTATAELLAVVRLHRTFGDGWM